MDPSSQSKNLSERTDLTKKMRVGCNFCEFSSSRYGCDSEQSLQEQDNLREKVERLRFLIKRMTGRDDDANFTELQALESHLKDVKRIVLDQKNKIKLEEDERLRKQNREAENESDGTRRGVLVSTNSSEKRLEKQDDGAMLLKRKSNFERRNSESFQSEFERLWLFNERMNGRELEGMSSSQLVSLYCQISRALLDLDDQMMRPRREQIAAREREEKESVSRLAEHERYSSDNEKDDDTFLQIRLLLVSRKLRRFHNRYQRKSLPRTRSLCQSRATSD
ncbi:unnamed protein product [Arabidopsis lyrata]|nr:unnamed protein product [Arabidopsis lyrata]